MTAPTLLLDAHAELGECPRWHAHERRLYWVDIARCELHRLDPATGLDEVRSFDDPVGCFAFRAAGGLVLGMKSGAALIDDFDGSLRPFGPQIFADRLHHRFNDGRTDPAGRFWIGSVNAAKDTPDAGLYRLNPDGTLTEIELGMMTANGAAFSADGARFCHADTPSHALRHYDVVDGALTNRRVFHQFVQGTGRPDGGSFDEEGCYWTALFDGGRVVRLSPAGELLATVTLPVTHPTMIAFGGGDRRTAFVTSARTGLTADALADQPHAGGIFTFRVDVPGVPEWSFAG